MTGERVDVLRLGYRLGRDPRITTHLALVGRALGADRFLLAGNEDPKMFENLESVASRFGGGMDCEHIKSPMGWLRRFVDEDAGDQAMQRVAGDCPDDSGDASREQAGE